MIKGNYLIRKFKGKKYYLNLENSEDISYTPPLSYNENFKFTPINRNINYFILHINDTCNMCCSYCFEKEKKNNKMQLKTIYELIDFINTSSFLLLIEQHNIPSFLNRLNSCIRFSFFTFFVVDCFVLFPLLEIAKKTNASPIKPKTSKNLIHLLSIF